MKRYPRYSVYIYISKKDFQIELAVKVLQPLKFHSKYSHGPCSHIESYNIKARMLATRREHFWLGSLRSQNKLLASLAQCTHSAKQTHSARLPQNHIPRQASSAHRSRCSLEAPPGGRSGRHQVARHCSLRSRRITYQDWRHLPIARVAC